MNYTIVLNGFVWLASMTYYVLFARKWYSGPKTTAINASSDSGDSNAVDRTYETSEPKRD